MNVINIVADYLKQNGYDGLVNIDGECGCELCDIHPCEEDISECRAAYKHKTNGALNMGEDWIMSTNKDWTPKGNDDECA